MEINSSTPSNKTISNFIQTDYITINLVILFISLLTSAGLLFGNLGNTNYVAMLEFAPRYFWALCFILYSMEKILEIGLLTSLSVRIGTSLLGLWLWSFIALSFLFYDQTKAYTLEYILVLPILLEVIYLSSLLYISRAKNKVRYDNRL